MKAVRCKDWGPIDQLVVEDLPELLPGAGEVVVDVKAAGVNFPDVLTVQGKYQVRPELPFTPGNEFAGTVRAVGQGVTGFAPGQHVIGFTRTGAFAEQAVAPVASLMPIPPGMDFDTAAAITLTYGTSHHAVVDRAALQPGETMLVLGAASTGSSGGAKGSLSMMTSESASPRTSTPSQKLWLPTSTALPALRKESSNSVRPRSPCTNSGNSSPRAANSSRRRSATLLTARMVVHRKKVRPPAASITGSAASTQASVYWKEFGSGSPVGTYRMPCSP